LKVHFREDFLKDVRALEDSALRKRVGEAIRQVEQATTLQDVRKVRKVKGPDQYDRIRVGDYRLGLVLQEGTVVFVRCLHRKDIYRYFGL
jgi:mRNA interferase RelE/StbE